MIILDVNVVINAHIRSARTHDVDRGWLAAALNGPRPIGLPLVTALGFVRMTTNARALDPPIGMDDALDAMSRLRGGSAVEDVTPADGHWDRVRALAADTGMRGAETTDLHLAALALERGAALATRDRGFRRFPDLEVIEPPG